MVIKINVNPDFAKAQIQERGDKIRNWATQNDNLLLKECANAVLQAARE